MSIIEVIRSVILGTKKLDTTKLPSQSLFYPKGFEIKIKKADLEDIITYEFNYDKDSLFDVIESVKEIVRKNTIYNKLYKFEDIKSVDIVYIFLEIVKFTTGKPISIPYFNDELGKPDKVEFSSSNFNYYDLSKFKDSHNSEHGYFLVDGYRFSMPSIGVENCLTQFLVSKSGDVNAEIWNDYAYDFLFFLCGVNNLSFPEIENLVIIFNSDMDVSEREKVKLIIENFMGIINYTLKINNRVIDVKAKLDLEKIWKI